MADDNEDPDIKVGREIAAGKKPAQAPVVEDPDIAAGRAIAGTVPKFVPTGAAVRIDQPGQGMSWRGVGRNIGAGLTDAGGGLINLLTDPFGTMVQRPLGIVGAAAYDFLAPHLGLDRLTPEQRADLTGAGAQPEEQGVGPRIVSGIGSAIGVDPSKVEATPAEKVVRAATAGAVTAGAVAPAVAPVLAGAVGGATGNVAAQNVPEWAKPVAELAGNVVGAGTVGAATTAQRVARGAVSDVSAADAALAQTARDKYKIPVDANDLSSNSLYRIAADQASKLPFSGAKAAADAKQSAWQGAIAKEMGENATAFTSDVMDRAKTRIGAEFDRVARTTSIDAPSVNTMIGDLATIERDMNMVLPTNELPKIKAQLDNIIDVAAKQGGTVSGNSYQALTRKGAPLDLAERSTDPNVRHVAGQIRDALDDAFVRSASPADQAALVQAKYQYRIMRTVDQLAAKSRDGNITPEGFRAAVVSASRRFDSPTGGIAYTGGGNIGELSKIGQLMRTPPQTGTADRGLINLLALGGTGAPLIFNPAYAATVPAMLAANRVGGSYLRSGFLADQVIRNALRPPLPSPYALAPSVITGSNPLSPAP